MTLLIHFFQDFNLLYIDYNNRYLPYFKNNLNVKRLKASWLSSYPYTGQYSQVETNSNSSVEPESAGQYYIAE